VSSCTDLPLGGPETIADALVAVDCRAGEATAVAFGRLFGTDGALLPALTILLTIYIAWLAIGLLTGRARLGVGLLTGRMMGLGLALTLATSWMAYQSTVYTLATGAPDEIGSVLMGTRGSATLVFAERLDILFGAIAEAAESATPAAAPATDPLSEGAAAATQAAPAASGGWTGTDLLWPSALMLLLGTAGVLLTAKIALAALLAVGPVFVVLALFAGTRGLFEGWAKGVVMFALVPLLAVLLGGAVVELIVPIVQGMTAIDGTIEPRAAVTLFLAASVYLALMAMAVKVASTLISGWRIPFSRETEQPLASPASSTGAAPLLPAVDATGAPTSATRTIRPVPMTAMAGGETVVSSGSDARSTTIVRHLGSSDATLLPGGSSPALSRDRRALGVGSRFRLSAPSTFKEKIA
jgi:type IV secretion system protein VirB6